MAVTYKYLGEPVSEAEFYAALLRGGSYLTTTQDDDVTLEIVDIYDRPPQPKPLPQPLGFGIGEGLRRRVVFGSGSLPGRGRESMRAVTLVTRTRKRECTPVRRS